MHYRPLMLSLKEPDSLYVYSVYSNWGSGVEYFISFKNSKPTGGYYISADAAFNVLAGRALLRDDSLSHLSRTIIDSTPVEEITRFVAANNLWTLPEEKDLMLICPTWDCRNDTIFNCRPLIEDGPISG